MARLIDADAMRDYWLQNGENEYVYDTNAVLDSIDSQPTVDAVEVVRCINCKKWDKDTWFCNEHSTFGHYELDWNMFAPNDFCSYGERKDGGGNA